MDSEEEDMLKEFLDRNSCWHIIGSQTFHSWPCGLWLDSKSNKEINWTEIFCHGFVPRNWKILTDDPF